MLFWQPTIQEHKHVLTMTGGMLCPGQYCSAKNFSGRKCHAGKFCGRKFHDIVRKQAFRDLCFDNFVCSNLVFRFLKMQ